MGTASDGTEKEQVIQRDKANCSVDRELVTLLGKDLARQLDCTDWHSCWEKQRDT